MAKYNGKTAAFAFTGGAVLDSATNSWTVTTTSDVADGTNMNDAWMTNLPGLTDFTGTVESDADTTADYPAILGLDAAATFYFVDTAVPKLAGNAIITGVSESVSIDDIGKVSFTLEGNDAAGLEYTGA